MSLGGPAELANRALPLSDGFADFAFAEVNLGQMVVHGGVARHVAQGFPQLVFGLRQLIQAEVDPSQAIQVRAAGGRVGHCFAHQVTRFLQALVAVRQHIAQVVERSVIVRIHVQHLAKLRFGRRIVFHALVHGATAERDVLLVLAGLGQGIRGVQRLGHFVEVLGLLINVGQVQIHFAIVLAVHQPAGFRRPRHRSFPCRTVRMHACRTPLGPWGIS